MELSCHMLSKSYGNKRALSEVNFNLSPGIHGLLGPNGAGKSTLINILAGNLQADSGQLCWNGEDIRSMGRRFRQKLGYMPQQQAMYPSFTAYNFLFYIATLRGLSKAQAKARIPTVLEQVGLWGVANNRIGTLSGGMKQRLLLAQAILGEPELLVLDEPTAGLDPEQRIAVRNLIGALAKNRIVLISTHIVSDIEYISESLLLLQKGTLLNHEKSSVLLNALYGKVYDVTVPAEQVSMIQKTYKVGIISYEGDVAHLRLVSDTTPPYPCVAIHPNLEDIYIQYFRGNP